jgi:purine-binding chemotaxis protein CheW
MSETRGSEGLVRLGPGQLPAEVQEETRRVILFQACDEWLALPLETVREVQPLDRITRIPTAPAEVRGVLNLRGRVLTLFGLEGCLGIPKGDESDTHVVVLELGDPDLRIGIAVQQIGQVRRIPVSAVGPPAREGASGGLEGVFESEGKVVGLLDLARVFARFLPEWGVTLEPRGVRDLQPR